MPLIDVSDVLLDPMIAGEAFLVVRRLEVVNSFGESVVTMQSFAATGSIIPTGNNSLVREEAYQIQAKTIRVVTAFPLRGVSKDSTGTYQPDIVMWNNDSFIVKSLNDYTSYGVGLVEAECSSIDPVDAPPP